MEPSRSSGAGLAAAITRAASRQTYDTIRWLADGDLAQDAYRAYAYFRWVDDWLDQEARPREARLAFVRRQEGLIAGQVVGGLTPEEGLALDLLRRAEPGSGLHIYLQNLMAVMAFDADRRGRVVSQKALDEYTYLLASAVTEAMHYFIGHRGASPRGPERYRAVSGAHITHMLRDTREDIEAGYYNIPGEVLEAQGMGVGEVEHPGYQEWVQGRVAEARACFQDGRKALSQVTCLRCRVAGYAYMHRFEGVLEQIETDGFRLRKEYAEHGGAGGMVKMAGWALWMALRRKESMRGWRGAQMGVDFLRGQTGKL